MYQWGRGRSDFDNADSKIQCLLWNVYGFNARSFNPMYYWVSAVSERNTCIFLFR